VLFEKIDEILIYIFSTIVRSKNFDLSIVLVCDKMKKFLKT
jgi:hypothetical protein